MKKLLMHACCGPCFTYIEHDLKTNGMLREDGTYEKVDYTAFFYNPNIHPKVEYERRKQAFIQLCELKKCKYVVEDEYNLNSYIKYVVENVGKDKKYLARCQYCYYMRLKKAFEYAKANNFDFVSTTLTISPYQNHNYIIKAGEKLQEEYGVKFKYIDYRQHFREGHKMARDIGFYMQKYCGCVFSIDDGKWNY